MKKIDFGNIYFEYGSIVIEKLNSQDKASAKNIEINFDQDHQYYIVTANVHKDIYVCSQENGEKTDVIICEIEEEVEINDDLLSLIDNEVLHLINYSYKNLYVDHRKNQYTGERNFFLFLKKGSYKSKETSTVEYISNNILVR